MQSLPPTTGAHCLSWAAWPRSSAAGFPPAPGLARRPAGPVTVVIDDATVRFPGTGEPVLRGVNLTARSGRWTAITGASGTGKTTVLSLISGIRQPASGTVRWVTPAGPCRRNSAVPEGLDTVLGEGGWGISAGEARRIAVARAFLADAELWVLDEPTAHLDPGTEALVIDALHRATQGRTVIVATHSAALARRADVLFTVADGTVQAVRQATVP